MKTGMKMKALLVFPDKVRQCNACSLPQSECVLDKGAQLAHEESQITSPDAGISYHSQSEVHTAPSQCISRLISRNT